MILGLRSKLPLLRSSTWCTNTVEISFRNDVILYFMKRNIKKQSCSYSKTADMNILAIYVKTFIED